MDFGAFPPKSRPAPRRPGRPFPLRGWLAASFAIVAGCTPVADPGPSPIRANPPPHRAHPAAAPTPRTDLPLDRSRSAPFAPTLRTARLAEIAFTGVAFDARSHRLVVVDQPDGPGSRFGNAAAAAAHAGGLCAVNAGFFTPEGDPLGAVVTDHRMSGTWNAASSLGAGIWCEERSGRMMLVRRHLFDRGSARGMRGLLQAGPMLVADRHIIAGLDEMKPAVRSLLVWDGGDRWWMGRTSPCTLAALGRALAQDGPAGWPVRHALNLDGGRSSELWVGSSVGGGPLTQRPDWNRVVRNHLVLVPR
jgi:hypothetical protein